MVKKEVKKGNNLLLFVLIIGILLLFGAYMGVYFAGRNRSIKRRNEEKVEVKKYDIDVENISIEDEKVKGAMKEFESFGFGEKAFINDSLEIEDLSKYDYILATLNNVERDKIAFCIADDAELKEPVSIDYLNERLHLVSEESITIDDIVGNGVDNGLTVGEYQYGLYSIRVSDIGLYIIGACHGDMNVDSPYMYEVYKAETYEDYLNVYVKVAFGKMADNDYFDWYNNSNREGKPVEELYVSANPDVINLKYPMYKIIFLKVGDNYIFQGIENRL